METAVQKITPRQPCFICHAQNFSWFCQKNSFNLWRCRDCGLLFVYPLPDPKSLYSADYFSAAKAGFGYVDYDYDKQPMVPVFKQYLAYLKKLAPGPGGRLLDLGAATGFFVNLAQADGWQAQGVEISDYAAKLGRQKDLDILTGTLTSLSLPESAYQAITMLDVLEHLTDPLPTLKEAYKILSPRGLLLINTPDAGSWLAKLLGKGWHLLVPPEHLHYFNRNNLKKFLSDNGFKVVLETKIGKTFTLEYIFKTLYLWQKLALWKFLSRLVRRGWLKKISLPIHLRDNLLLIAQKNDLAKKTT